VRFEGRDYVLTTHGLQQVAGAVNEIGEKILGHLRGAPIDFDLTQLMQPLLAEYDVDPSMLEDDVCRFLRHCIEVGALAEPGSLKLFGLDLSLTNKCNATCVYCPTPRIKDAKRLLSLGEVDKLIDDLLSPEFQSGFGRLSTIEIGGLSEPLLHRHAVEILRRFKARYPTPFVILYTNAVLLTEDRVSALLDEGLISSLVVSIDGLDDREHFAAKGVRYAAVETNVQRFIRMRNDRASGCRVVINVLPYAKYEALVHKYLNRDPLDARRGEPALDDRTDEIIAKWKPLLAESDEIRDAEAFFQLRGEYRSPADTFPLDEKDLKCPWFDYVAHSLSVTSNGDVVICCNDFYKESVLGNFLTSSLYEIATGPRRRFIEQLARNDPGDLPSRCRHKKYCQFLSFGENGESHDLSR
jgi:MoaA/NifB/PqqE/SkfB family radical SAM enzyme